MKIDKRRDQIKVLFKILQLIDLGEHISTRIMFAANSNWESFNNLMDIILMRGLAIIRVDKRHKRFYITVKGVELLNHWFIIDHTLHLEEVLPLNTENVINN